MLYTWLVGLVLYSHKEVSAILLYGESHLCCMVNPICVGGVMNQQLRHTQNILFIEELTQYPGVYYTEYACKWCAVWGI